MFQRTKQEEERILNNGEREGFNRRAERKQNGMESQTGQVMCVRLTSEEVEIEEK